MTVPEDFSLGTNREGLDEPRIACWRIFVDPFFVVLRLEDGSGRVSSRWRAPRDLDLARLDSAIFAIRVAQLLISSACHSSLLDSSAGESMQYTHEPGRTALSDCARLGPTLSQHLG